MLVRVDFYLFLMCILNLSINFLHYFLGEDQLDETLGASGEEDVSKNVNNVNTL